MPYPLGYGGFLIRIALQMQLFNEACSDYLFPIDEAKESRRKLLEKFLVRVAKHPVLGSSRVLHFFLVAANDKVHKHLVWSLITCYIIGMAYR